MNEINRCRLSLYERCEDGIISIEERDVLLEEVSNDNLFLEKKTRDEYTRERFKKKHNYDPKTGTIDIDGKRVKVDMDNNDSWLYYKNGKPYKNVRRTTAVKTYMDDDTPSDIELDKKFFKLKNDKRREAVLQHEIGHLKMHNMKPKKVIN